MAAPLAVAKLVLPVVSEAAEDTYAVVADAEHVRFLQRECRLYGTPEGCEASANASPSLRLSLEEIAVGLAHGFLRLQAPSDATLSVETFKQEVLRGRSSMEEPDVGSAVWGIPVQRHARMRVFRDLWEKGYVVTFGSKFGADFLIYKDDPVVSHAVALIIVKDFDEEFPRVDVVSYCRVAKMVKKQLLFACVRPKANATTQPRAQEDSREGVGASASKDDVVYISLTHALLISRQEDGDEVVVEEEEEVDRAE